MLERKLWSDEIRQIESWKVLQRAANTYLERGLKREQEVMRKIRNEARRQRRKLHDVWWTQYATDASSKGKESG